MKLLSLNVGGPQERVWNNNIILTSIFKKPVYGKTKVSFLNIEGDQQSDLRVHGGINKAIYAYDISHYDHWKNIMPRNDWEQGMFGENLTTSGLVDDEVRIGNIYKVGSVKLQVVQPRFPCFKINIRFNLPDMIERFANERRSGIYFKVLEEGFMEENDAIELAGLSPFAVTVSQYAECYYSKGADRQVLQTLLSVPFLPERHRTVFEGYL